MGDGVDPTVRWQNVTKVARKVSPVAFRQGDGTSADQRRRARRTVLSARCDVCGRRGHRRAECKVRCYRCGKIGYVRRNCRTPDQGNGDGGGGLSVGGPPSGMLVVEAQLEGRTVQTGRHRLFCDIGQRDSCDEALREGTENVSRSDGRQQDLNTE